jgi:hypothetical protein
MADIIVNTTSTTAAIQQAIYNAATTQGVNAEELAYLAAAQEKISGPASVSDIQSLADVRKADIQTTADAALSGLSSAANTLVATAQTAVDTMVTDAQQTLSNLASTVTGTTVNQTAFGFFVGTM